MRARVVQALLDDADALIVNFIAERTRGKSQAPMTLARFERSFINAFIAPVPQNDEFETPADRRGAEHENFVWLTNLVADRSLVGRWEPERGDAAHHKAERLYLAGSVRAWTAALRDAIAPVLHVVDADERPRLLYRDIDAGQRQTIEQLVDRLFAHKVWEDESPELRALSYDNANQAKDLLREHGFTASYVLGGD